MAARIARLRTKADRLRADAAAKLRRLVLDHPGLPERARGEIVGAIDCADRQRGRMDVRDAQPEQNAAVMRWLRSNRNVPTIALALWGELFTALRHDTGQVMLTRDELAERVGTRPDPRLDASCLSWRTSVPSSSIASRLPGCAGPAVPSTS